MCGENVRDGLTTKTIPLDQEDCANKNCTTDSEYGMHEDYMHYYQCKNRERNHRLFTSTQKLKAGVFSSLYVMINVQSRARNFNTHKLGVR